MSKLEDLIAEFCPNGVKVILLEEIIISLNTGLNPRRFFQLNTTDAKNYYVTIREMQNQRIVFTDKTDRINDEALQLCNNRSNLEVGDILFSGTGTIGEVAIIEEEPKNWNIKEGIYTIKPDRTKVMPRFMMYLLMAQNIREKYLQKAAGGTIKSVPMGEMKKLFLPMPPLPIQQEIVRILDKFTELGEELEEELEARKKQYVHYALNHLSFESETEYVKIGDLCTVEKGKTPLQKAIAGKYPLVATTEERQSSNEYQFDCQAACVPLISAKGHGVASISRIYYQEGKFALGNILCAIIPINTDILYSKFLRYYLFFKKETLLVPLMRGGANVSLTIDSIRKVKIPLIPIDEQYRIVKNLDKFEMLCSSMTQGLPAEIEARRKQYQYYRDKLLTFKEKVS